MSKALIIAACAYIIVITFLCIICSSMHALSFTATVHFGIIPVDSVTNINASLKVVLKKDKII